MERLINAIANEEARLNALRDLRLLDTPPSESFDRLTRLASQLLGAPVSTISLTDRDRQWFKSKVGVDLSEIPRHQAPCSYAIEGTGVFSVEDLTVDPRFVGSPLAEAGIRFYAGAPLITRSGHGLGTLAVVDDKPRKIAANEITILRDLAAMVMSQIELQNMIGRVDSSTGLPNQHQLFEDLEDLGGMEAETGVCLLVELMSAAQAGNAAHAVGTSRMEAFVQRVSAPLLVAAGPGARLYHVGGMRCVLLLGPNAAEKSCVIAAMQQALRRPVLCDGVPLVADAHFGIYEFDVAGAVPRDVLRRLLLASAEAATADSRVALFLASQDESSTRRFVLLNDFATALQAQGQLSLVYQPRIDLASGRMVGVEALLRWRHPTLGQVPPGEFVPLIEQTAMARPMMDWVAQTAFRQLHDWGRSDLCVSVNASAHNLGEADFAERMLAFAKAEGIDPARLEIEFTESAVARDGAQVIAQLERLRAAGIQTAIDDFGTGYSNLAYVQRLPVSILKIDQSFVRELDRSKKDQAVVRSVIDMAHHLGFRVVGEGIETQGAFDLLRQWGCEEGQGYLMSRPVSADAIAAHLADCDDRPTAVELTGSRTMCAVVSSNDLN